MTKTICLFEGLFMAATSVVAYGQSPASITAPPDGTPVAYDVVGGLDPAVGEIILDQLCVHDRVWERGFGDACGGEGAFGREYDLQAAEDFELLEPATLTGFVSDYLQFSGPGAGTVCVSVYAGGCDAADESPICFIETAPDAVFSIWNPYGNYSAMRYVVKQELCDLSPG